jgi:hypothetical protein
MSECTGNCTHRTRCEATRLIERARPPANGPQKAESGAGPSTAPESLESSDKAFAARRLRWPLAVSTCCSAVEFCQFINVEREVAPSFG